MPEPTGSPRQLVDEQTPVSSVSLASSPRASGHLTSNISSSLSDGTSAQLPHPSLSASPVPSTPDMAVKPLSLMPDHPQEDHEELPTKAKFARIIEEPTHLHLTLRPDSQTPETGSSDAEHGTLHLSRVARSLRLRDHQWRRCIEIQDRLRSLQLASARTNRLIHIAQTVQHTLAECIKSEDKHSFSNLFNAFLDASDGVVMDPISEREPLPVNDVGYRASALDLISSSSRVALLDLCYRVRHDGDYIADCLASLSHKELLAILPDRTTSRYTESVFGPSSWHHSRTSRHLGFVVDSQMELLQSSECASPLHTMFHFARSISATPTTEDARMFEVWATVCARLIADQKPGSEKVVPAVLDILAFLPGWTGKSRLEGWISQTLEKGAFLTEQPSKQSFRTRVLGRSETPAEDHSAIEAFYSNSVSSLLDILGDDQGPSVIPPSVLRMCHAISAKLELNSVRQRAFPQFVITRWLFSSFLPELLILPEASGMAADIFVSDPMRQRILREIAIRAQRAVYDVCYSWKHGSPISIEVTSQVQAIVCRLTNSAALQDRSEGFLHFKQLHQPPNEEAFVAITTGDLVSMVRALFPQRRPVSFTFDGESASSGLHSSSSSISGYSLFQNTAPSHFAIGSPPEVLRDASREPIHATLGSSDTLNDLNTTPRSSWSESHGEPVREACAAMEELCSGHEETFGSWAILLMGSGESASRTTLESLRSTSGSEHGPERVKTISDDRRRCTKAIEDLLLTGQAVDTVNQREYSKTSYSTLDAQHDLLKGFKRQILDAEQRGDFLDGYFWSQKLHEFERSTTDDNTWHLQSVVDEIERSAMAHISNSRAVMNTCERWIGLLEPILESSLKAMTVVIDVAYQMRDKMWFVADVRTSAAYEAARSVANALRIMAKSKRQQRPQTSPPLRHWSAPKLTMGQLHLKSDAQVLELLSTSPLQGGPNKLSDDQSKATAQWMESNNIENLCHGEERLHRLCMEIRKCVEQLTSGPSATFWSGPLFSRDKQYDTTLMSPSLAALQGTMAARKPLTLRTNVPPSIGSISSASHPLSSTSSRDHLDTGSPALTHRSSAVFWSPTSTEHQPPSSTTSVGSVPTQYGFGRPTRRRKQDSSNGSAQRIDSLRQHLTSLLLNDIASPLFLEGSETDRAYWTGISGQVSEGHLRSLRRNTERTEIADLSSGTPELMFNFEHAFTSLLHRFPITKNPYSKLDILHELDKLLSLQARHRSGHATPSTQAMPNLLASSRKHITLLTVDANVSGFRTLFCNSAIRPAGIFRDLQYIAALVPSAMLETTPQGKAFWNACVALLGLKQELRKVMVETADSIIAYHSNNRGHGRSASTAQLERDSATFTTPSRTPSAEDIARYSMSDAACMLQITAREGDRVAQRELATLYLTHPELMDHIIAPFTRPKDVFREELENKWRKNQDPNRCDPMTMCVAHHWMSLSSKAGDGLAKEFLKQREELSDF